MAHEHKEDDEASETANTGCGMFNVFKKKEFDKHAPIEKSCCGEDNGEKKKGLKVKIKEKLSRKKDLENRNTEKTNSIANGGGGSGLSLKEFLSKIKDKFPGQHTKAEHQDESKDKNGALDNNNNIEKLPNGNNKDEEKPKEN